MSTHQAKFEVLIQRLILQRLGQVLNTELHPLIIAAGREAAALARLSPFSFLLFPCLFEERAAAALNEERNQTRAYWATVGPLLATHEGSFGHLLNAPTAASAALAGPAAREGG